MSNMGNFLKGLEDIKIITLKPNTSYRINGVIVHTPNSKITITIDRLLDCINKFQLQTQLNVDTSFILDSLSTIQSLSIGMNDLKLDCINNVDYNKIKRLQFKQDNLNYNRRQSYCCTNKSKHIRNYHRKKGI